MTPEEPWRHGGGAHAGIRLPLPAVLVLCLLVTSCNPARKPFKEGEHQAKAGDYDRAVLSFSKALNEDPGNEQYRLALSRARFRASQVHFDKAKRYLQSERLKLAVEELQAAVFLDPTNDFAAVELEKAEAALAEAEDARSAINDFEAMKRKARQTLDAPKLDPASNIQILLKFKDEELGKIFDALSKATGINFLYDDHVELNKRVSIDQANVTFEEAMDLLMIQNKLFYKVHNPTTLIIIPDTRQKRQEYEDQVIKTFYLSNAEVKDVQTILRTLLDARKVAVNDQLNAITIKDTPDTVAVAERLVQNSDKAKAEVIVDVEIVEFDRSTLQNLGIDITTSSLSLTFQGGDEGSNLRLGELNALNNKAAYVLGPVPNLILNFLKTNSDAKVIAKPQVRVSEGERAQLNIGQRIPIPTTSFNTANTLGGNIVPLTSFTYQNVGISVEIEPRVHHNREVTLTVAVEVSALAGSIATTSGQSQPIIGTRNINTVIRLKEGETQILAGLIQENERKSLRTIPGFDKIPILRRIFGTHETQVDRTDIVLTLTPHIIRLPDIREDDLAAMWVGTSSNLVLRGAERSPFGSETPFTGSGDGDIGAAGPAGLSGGALSDGGGADAADSQASADETRTGDESTSPEGNDKKKAEEDEDMSPVSLAMVPLTPAAGVGDMIDLSVRIFGARNVVSTPFKLRFDPTHLRFVREGAVEGPFLRAGGNVAFFANLDSQNPGVAVIGLSILGPQGGGGVDGNGELCRLRFQVLPKAAEAGGTNIIPFENRVFAPGLNQLRSFFPSISLNISGGGS
ncbi:MAG: secretin N-terminal domain-containing protein [Acidobacteriota bacterium]